MYEGGLQAYDDCVTSEKAVLEALLAMDLDSLVYGTNTLVAHHLADASSLLKPPSIDWLQAHLRSVS